MYKISLSALLLLTCLFAQDEVPQDIAKTGNEVSLALMKQLVPKLQHEMKTNGLLSASKFCHENAFILTEEVNLHQLKGVSVKRISLKERNPANAASEDEKKVLESMRTMLEKNELPEYIITQVDNHYKYYKPLVIKKEACLKCHGDISKNPELNTFIKEHYPLDKTTGYKMNDLRGAILVEIQPF